jgi:hypothetical protein
MNSRISNTETGTGLTSASELESDARHNSIGPLIFADVGYTYKVTNF